MKNRGSVFVVLVFALLVALVARNYFAHHRSHGDSADNDGTVTKNGDGNSTDADPNSPELPPKAPPKPPEPKTPDGPTPLRIADDAELKTGEFWLEQPFYLFDAPETAKQDLVELYINFDPQTQAGLRVRAGGLAVALEKIVSKDAAPEVLFTTLPPAFNKGDHVLGAQWRRGELTIWHNDELLMTWKPTADDRAFAAGAGALAAPGQTVKGLPSGVRVTATNVKLGARRAIPLSTIRFDDDFMRESGDGRWQPQSGRWELTGMAFPERSANPFALRATFTNDPPDTDTFYKGREREGDFGLGIMLSPFEGTLHIARISGGSAAARAGMQEDDIFVDIDGTPVDEQNGRFAHQLLARGFGNAIHLKMLRPGEKKLRELTVTPEQYKWATPIVGTPIQPVSAPSMLSGEGLSLITTGERGWSDYAAEVSVKPLGSGGMGMAVAVLSRKDYVMFRWHGPSGRPAAGATPLPPPRNDGPAAPLDKLELVRVVNGQETILAEKNGGYRPYEFYRLGMDWNGDQIQCLIDGNVVLSATVPGLKRGQVGLCALQGDPVFFDDVHIAADRSQLAATHAHERKLNNIFVFEDDMEVWANPALEWQRDPSSPWAVHQARFPGENKIVILNTPRFNELSLVSFAAPVSEKGDTAIGDDLVDSAANPRFVIKDGKAHFEGTGIDANSLDIGNAPIQRATIHLTDSTLEADPPDGLHDPGPA